MNSYNSSIKDEHRRKTVGLFRASIFIHDQAKKHNWSDEDLEINVLGALGLTDDDLYKAAYRQASMEED